MHYNFKDGRKIFNLFDGINYNNDTNSFTLYDNTNFDINFLQQGFNVYDENGIELFLGDVVYVPNLEGHYFLGIKKDYGIVLTSLRDKKTTYPFNEYKCYYMGDTRQFNTNEYLKLEYLMPKFIFEAFRLELDAFRFKNGVTAITNLMSLEVDVDLQRVNQAIYKDCYIGSMNATLDNGKVNINKK